MRKAVLAVVVLALSPSAAMIPAGAYGGQPAESGLLTVCNAAGARPNPCNVPSVFGFGLTAAKAAVRKAHCGVGAVLRVYSKLYQARRVFGRSPRGGSVLAPGAPVSLTVGRGLHR